MNIIISMYVFFTGTILGSFYNVVGLRLPKNLPFAISRSYCPHCLTLLQARDLIPLLSYFLSRGKCRHCAKNISYTYLLVEFLTGILFLLAYLRLGLSSVFIGACSLISLAVIVSVSDLKYMVIPNRLLLFFGLFFVVYRFIYPLNPWYDSILGAVTGFGLIFIIIFISKGGIGAGDMKLLGTLGILLGMNLTLLTFFLAVILGTVISFSLLIFKVIGRKDPFPFGPSIVGGSMVSYLFGNSMLTFYFEAFYF
ncbi:prepilin peptidase [Halobacillus karajensis]|uniref:Late competence protein ComC n=1 Tax=Halobacillus karajensis TaxID=195088 RepID=A0A024P650_9BACI|nr:A24 family peptidase [Halobacillus karajensis]CDQ18182.1 Late competence protein ComC [Halobacillus karajensis]CDQ24534.1 Late competence protein ComC [Halobacillus karajensis]CDQ29219.1 Late competence protein ComC [Halobacillus karajensis]